MEGRRSKIRGCIYLLTIFLAASIAFLPLRAFAGDMEIMKMMIDEMVKQGIVTQEQGDKMLKDMEERKAKEQEKAVQEKAKVEGLTAKPDWAKNLPDWIVNPPDWIKRIQFSGDFRLRFDYLNRQPTAAQEASGTQDFANYRARIRLRLGAETEIVDGLKVGFGIATSPNTGYDPRSNMVTLGGGFSKKVIDLNYAYVAYTPSFLPWVTISGGKLRYNPIYQANSYGVGSTFLWDQNITPEGFAVVFNYPNLFKFNEFSLDVFMNNTFFILDQLGTGGANPYVSVFQPGFNLKFMKDFNLKFATAYYEFNNIKHEAEIAGGAQPDPGDSNTFIASGPLAGTYRYNYNAFVESGELGYMTPFPNIIPYLGIFGEIVRNIDSHEGGYQGGVRFGYPSLNKFGDWQFSYAYRRLEADAWLDILNENLFYQGQTNVKGHYVWFALGLMKHVNATISYYHGDNIVGAKQSEDRFLVDLNVVF